MDYEAHLNEIDQSFALDFGWCPRCSGILLPRHIFGSLHLLCVNFPRCCQFYRRTDDLEKQKYYDYWEK